MTDKKTPEAAEMLAREHGPAGTMPDPESRAASLIECNDHRAFLEGFKRDMGVITARLLDRHSLMATPPQLIESDHQWFHRLACEHSHTHGKNSQESKTQPFRAGWPARWLFSGPRIAQRIRRAWLRLSRGASQ